MYPLWFQRVQGKGADDILAPLLAFTVAIKSCTGGIPVRRVPEGFPCRTLSYHRVLLHPTTLLRLRWQKPIARYPSHGREQ